MTARKVYLEPTGPLNLLFRPSAKPADKNLLDPAYLSHATTPTLVDGEWVTYNDAGKIVRAADLTQVAGTVAAKRSFLWWEEVGRYDVQAIQQGNIMLLGAGEFNTLIFDSALNGGISDGMQALKVAVVVIDGIKRSGLIAHSGTDQIVGYSTLLPAKNGGKLRFVLGYLPALSSNERGKLPWKRPPLWPGSSTTRSPTKWRPRTAKPRLPSTPAT